MLYTNKYLWNICGVILANPGVQNKLLPLQLHAALLLTILSNVVNLFNIN